MKLNEQSVICGLDEAGRGALAGPIVAALVGVTPKIATLILSSGLPIRDGKSLSKNTREKIAEFMQTHAIPYQIKTESALRINNYGIQKANRNIFRSLIASVNAKEYIVDGNIKIGFVSEKTNAIQSVIHGDATILPVILAGIIAKVTRDRIMTKLSLSYPFYAWDKNCGYGTLEHIRAIIKHGTTKYHRTEFANTAIRHYLDKPTSETQDCKLRLLDSY